MSSGDRRFDVPWPPLSNHDVIASTSSIASKTATRPVNSVWISDSLTSASPST